ncbi:MAG: CYTH domain-containing protein [Phycisphaerales bacterium]|nr:MAG: CYTH domain-containing protein [Phycisphaerales bacterium]
MQNIEFKAELRDLPAARQQCQTLGAVEAGRFEQVDTYFRLTDGRLKRRESTGEPTQWIFYHRPDRARPRMSNFSILSDEEARRRWGTHSLTEWLRVTKTRELWMLDSVRIHLDLVNRLGTFIEFEAPVSKTRSVERCHEEIAVLRKTFMPILGEPVSASYSDLMALDPASST